MPHSIAVAEYGFKIQRKLREVAYSTLILDEFMRAEHQAFSFMQ